MARVVLSVGALLATFIATTFVTLLNAPPVQAQETRNPVFVLKLGSVDVALAKTDPPSVLVKATGIVATGGYAHPRLLKVLYEKPPADGIQDLYFLVDPPAPGTFVPQVIMPVEASGDLGQVPGWMRGVRVWAQTNRIEKSL